MVKTEKLTSSAAAVRAAPARFGHKNAINKKKWTKQPATGGKSSSFLLARREAALKAREEEKVPKIDIDGTEILNGRPKPLAKNVESHLTFGRLPDPNQAMINLSDPSMMSRLLYPNPVCFLTTIDVDKSKRNVMTLSWLAPANNYGGFIFAMHKTRHSANSVSALKSFVLSIPVATQSDLVLSVGKTSGKTVDKFSLEAGVEGLTSTKLGEYSYAEDTHGGLSKRQKKHNQQVIAHKAKSGSAFALLGDDSDSDEAEDATEDAAATAATEDDEKEEEEEEELTSKKSGGVGSSSNTAAAAVELDLAAVAGTIAHLKCEVITLGDAADAGHMCVVAQIKEAWVHPEYWHASSKNFLPVSPELPPMLSFLGSQKFAHITAPASSSFS